MAANADRCPVSARCEILDAARPACYSMRSRRAAPAPPDPVEPAVLATHEASRGRYGVRKIKSALSRDGITASRRRICRIMRENGLNSAYGCTRFKCHVRQAQRGRPAEHGRRGLGGRAPCTHVCSDPTYVRVSGGWNYVCLLVDLSNREIVGHSAGPRQRVRQRED